MTDVRDAMRNIRFRRYLRLNIISFVSIIAGIAAYFNEISAPMLLVDITGVSLILALILGFISIQTYT